MKTFYSCLYRTSIFPRKLYEIDAEGNNSASVVADTYLKGISTDGAEEIYAALVHGSENVHPIITSSGRLGHEYYNTLGYIPYDVNIRENVARTLEYAYNDWCIALMAEKMGRPALLL